MIKHVVAATSLVFLAGTALAGEAGSMARSNRWGERRRKAEDEGKASFAKLCRAQQRYHRDLRGRARQALRTVVQAPAAKSERPSQLSLFSEDEATA